MYDNESKNGIIVYTVVFFVLLVSFIGFLIYRGSEDSKENEIPKSTKRAMIRSSN